MSAVWFTFSAVCATAGESIAPAKTDATSIVLLMSGTPLPQSPLPAANRRNYLLAVRVPGRTSAIGSVSAEPATAADRQRPARSMRGRRQGSMLTTPTTGISFRLPSHSTDYRNSVPLLWQSLWLGEHGRAVIGASPVRRSCMANPGNLPPEFEWRAAVPVLHQMQMSGNCYKVRLAAHQLGVPLTLEEYPLFGGRTRRPE